MAIPEEWMGIVGNSQINIIDDASIPAGTIYLVPKVEIIRVINAHTGAAADYYKWNPKAGAVITNVASPDSGQENK